MQDTTERKDVYSRTTQIVEYLERCPSMDLWWNAKHAAGRINRPLRLNGQT